MDLRSASMRSMRMRLPSWSAQIKPTARSGALAFLTIAWVGAISRFDETSRDKESLRAIARFACFGSQSLYAFSRFGVCLFCGSDAVLGDAGMERARRLPSPAINGEYFAASLGRD